MPLPLRHAAALIGVVVASGTARSQPIITYSLTWSEVWPGANAPPNSGPGQQAGRIDPGEGVRLAIRVTITPGIGSSVTYSPPPPPGVGTIAGFGSMFLDILGTNLSGGTWANINRNPGYNWGLGEPGTAQPNGNLLNAQAGQWPLPGSTANSSNPVINIWRGTWMPSSYAPRTVSFTTAPAVVASGSHSSVLVQYGTSPIGAPEYVDQYVGGAFGGIAAIPIVPSPGALSLLLPAMLGAGRCRKTNREG